MKYKQLSIELKKEIAELRDELSKETIRADENFTAMKERNKEWATYRYKNEQLQKQLGFYMNESILLDSIKEMVKNDK